MQTRQIHSFHIPVMGTGYSIDTAVKVAPYGIHSVLSLVDDTLIEHMRKYYCEKEGEPYTSITKYDEDFRARRITAYLDLIHKIIERKFQKIKHSHFEPGSEINKYFELLDDASPLKEKYQKMLKLRNPLLKLKLQEELRSEMRPGDINVNIMTKLDRDNYDTKGNKLAPEFSDALSALRGFALSTVRASIVFSAGINRRLYTYVEQFKDFYADETGEIKKKIILKVSDFRSSIIQGKFFAQKGLWISEYRIESGLNCGGHAFASDGYLMGPILEEFRTKREEMIAQLHASYNKALGNKNLPVFDKPHQVKITAQGGIGTRKEDEFLRKHYNLDGTGWATPFLLCPEATNCDDVTLQKLARATENDLYLSDVSPLGVPFNNLRGSLSDTEKEARVFRGRAGSACPKGHLVSNTEFTPEPICTASRQYQKLKIDQLNNASDMDPEERKIRLDRIVTKACICHDLGESAILANQIQTKVPGFSAVCPGPNIAYFSKIVTLKEMIDHIYGRINLITHPARPHMFIKELHMYIDYLRKDIEKYSDNLTEQKTKYFAEFKNNLLDGIQYYKGLYPQMSDETVEFRDNALAEVENCRQKLLRLVQEYSQAFATAAV
jgi:hypothetical protein